MKEPKFIIIHTPTLDLFKRCVKLAQDKYKTNSMYTSCYEQTGVETCLLIETRSNPELGLGFSKRSYFEEDPHNMGYRNFPIISAEEFLGISTVYKITF